MQCRSVTASAAHRGVWPTAFPTEILEGKWASPYLFSSLTQAELGSPRPVETSTGVCLPSFLSGGKDRLSRLLHEGSWESPLLVLYFLHCVAVPRMVGGVEGQAGAARPVGGKPLGLLSAVAVVLFWGVERPRPGLGWWASPWSPGKVPASSQAVFSCLGLLRAG